MSCSYLSGCYYFSDATFAKKIWVGFDMKGHASKILDVTYTNSA